MKGQDGITTGIIVVLLDVTREREVSRMKSEFIAVAAHELSTPLASVMGYAELLLDQGDSSIADEGQRREFLSIIYEKSGKLAGLIDEMLQLGRMEAGRRLLLEKGPFNFLEEIRSTLAQYRLEWPGYRFKSDLPEEEIELVADGGKLRQVLENLLSNAVKYSRSGSRIVVRAKTDGDALEVCVEDEGIGMTGNRPSGYLKSSTGPTPRTRLWAVSTWG